MTCKTCQKARAAMWDDFKGWAARPFSADMDAFHWFYFMGLLLVIAFAWGSILGVLKRAGQ